MSSNLAYAIRDNDVATVWQTVRSDKSWIIFVFEDLKFFVTRIRTHNRIDSITTRT